MEQERIATVEQQMRAIARELHAGKIDAAQANQRKAAIVEADPQAAAHYLDPYNDKPAGFAADSPLHDLAEQERLQCRLQAAGATDVHRYLELMRMAAGLSRYQLAQKMGLKASTEIGLIETRQKHPTAARVELICKALGADYHHAITLEGVSMSTVGRKPVSLEERRSAGAVDTGALEVMWEKGEYRVVRRDGRLELERITWERVKRPSAEMEALLLELLLEASHEH